jgi:hypothetical protein
MSLDVYLYEVTVDIPPELCLTCVVSAPDEHAHQHCVFDANVTHNLGAMAEEAGIYTACWRPNELMDPMTAAEIQAQATAKNWHGPGGVLALEAKLPPARARDISQLLLDGLTRLRAEPDRFKKFEPENKRGTYDGFVKWVAEYMKACMLNPNAIVGVSR